MASMEAVISSSTNWIVAEGSLFDSISFETSDDDAAAAESKRLLLRRPPSEEEDPPPCEITIIFRSKHVLHRVYLRSTARIYEMYYASDHQNTNMEYLCTVHCGAAVQEVTSPVVTEEADQCQGNDKGAAATPEQVARSGSTTSDEDGWIQVKVPDSTQENKKNVLSKSNDSPNMQNYYEATAEISDSSPCVSLTLRLFSVQTKDYVHVEEIYIYADPVDSTSLDPPTTMSETSGGSSLLAMLVPTLLGLSKSRSCRMQDKGSSEEPRGPNYQCDKKPVQTISISMDMGKTLVPEAYSSCILPEPIQEPSEVNSGKNHLETSKKVPELNQAPSSCTDQHTNVCYNRIEKSLDELLSRVGRIEAFCSRFEENMTKPINCMDVKLQGVEHKLDSLMARHQSSEQLLPIPGFLFEKSDSVNKFWNTGCRGTEQDILADTFLHQSSEQLLPVSEFLFEKSDSVNKFCNTECRGTEHDILADTLLPVDDLASSPPELGTCPGLVVQAPEFPNEDDDCVDIDDNLYEESISVNNLCNTKGREAREVTIADAALLINAMTSSSRELASNTGLVVKASERCTDTNDTLHSLLECPIKDKALSIDDVIASTLKAFLTSNTVRSPNTSSTSGEISEVCSVVTNGTLDSTKKVVSEDDDCERVIPIGRFVSQWNDEFNSYKCCSSLDEHFVANEVGIRRSDGGSIDSSRGDSTHVLISNDSDGESTGSSRGKLTPIAISDDSDYEKSGHISELRGRSMGEYSCNSSPDYFIKDEVDILNSYKGCIDSSHSAQQAGYSIYGNVLPVSSFENKSISHYDFAKAKSFEDYSQMKPNAGLGRELSSSTLDSEDIYDVSFAPEKDCVSGLPLEILLGESPDAREHNAVVMADEDGKNDEDGSLLLNLQDLALLTDDELKALDNIPLYTGLF